MKRSKQDKTLFNNDFATNKNLKTDILKTTNVNILLNRVRLDKKRSFRKKITILSSLVLIISAIAVFSII